MKKLLLMMLCLPAILAAQSNGVKVSNLAVSAGTVTFNVSWQKPMPVALWSDTVWVFVDYNKNGVMERLPVTGATTSAGTVTKISGNDKGVWVAGDARKNGSFSAKVELFTEIKDVAGACAYASNYPPVGEYTSINKIEFTGMPMYEIALTKLGGDTVTVKSGDTFLLPCNSALTSFTDATGAPGVMNCSMPGSTVNFTEFDPCPTAFIGDYWYLTDTREPNNVQTYKVKLMADGHIWMVQDLKFGDLCGTSFSSPAANQTGKVSSSGTYYGDCTASANSATPSNRGYLYDWPAAMNKADAYRISSYAGCSGTTTNTCQGICPAGWHIPTGASAGEFLALHTAGGCLTTNGNCWDASSAWEGVLGGGCYNNGTLFEQGIYGRYWSSTFADVYSGYYLCYNSTIVYPALHNDTYDKDCGFAVRCVRNY
jgi:uncharacterized protein (TIGR02145 family)